LGTVCVPSGNPASFHRGNSTFPCFPQLQVSDPTATWHSNQYEMCARFVWNARMHGSADNWLLIPPFHRPSQPACFDRRTRLDSNWSNWDPGMSFHADWTLAGIAHGVAGERLETRIPAEHRERPGACQIHPGSTRRSFHVLRLPFRVSQYLNRAGGSSPCHGL
jgi:hypothetical protein